MNGTSKKMNESVGGLTPRIKKAKLYRIQDIEPKE